MTTVSDSNLSYMLRQCEANDLFNFANFQGFEAACPPLAERKLGSASEPFTFRLSTNTTAPPIISKLGICTF